MNEAMLIAGKKVYGDDPYFSYVKFLMNGTGRQVGDTVVSDIKGHAVSTIGGPAYSDEQKLFGLNTLKMDGVDDGISIAGVGADFSPGFADWTVDGWVFLTGYAASIIGGAFWSTLPGQKAGYGCFQGATEPTTRITSSASGGWADNLACGAGKGIPLNIWTMMSFEKHGDALRIYRGGQLVASRVGVAGYNYTGLHASIGVFNDGTLRYTKGYIGPTRFTNGMARYKGNNFALPTDKFAEVPMA